LYQEAKAASALNHPNILTIHDIYEDEGFTFIAMEYIEGELLTDILSEGPLKTKELIRIAQGISAGLHAAHQKGIIHRDIKPDNIMMSNDRVIKILDFGVAKRSGSKSITEEGSTIGTRAYMSPEQVSGEEIDQRSDIFSLGVVLYQLATGRMPFEGDHDAALVYSIVNEEAVPATTLNPNVPRRIEKIINKLLAKDVRDRYQHADEIITDLRRVKNQGIKAGLAKKRTANRLIYITTAIVAFGLIALFIYTNYSKQQEQQVSQVELQNAIAVLPFTTITKAEEDQIFTAGIHDDILTQVAKIGGLKVIARSSVIQYKDTEKGVSDIGYELGVRTVLVGSYRRTNDRVRVTAQLIDTESGDHLWAESFDREYKDVFDIQGDVAKKITEALKIKLTPEEKLAIEEIPTTNHLAYDYFNRGKEFINKGWDEKNYVASIPLFEKAIQIDSKYTIAYAELARAHLAMYWAWDMYSPSRLEQAQSALEEAIRLDPDHPAVHMVKGYFHYYGFRDYENALNEFEIALENQPNNCDLLSATGLVMRRQGRWDEALEYLRRSSDLDPLSFGKAGEAALTALRLRLPEIAEHYIEREISNNPSAPNGYRNKITLALHHEGDIEKAENTVNAAITNVSDLSDLTEIRGHVEYIQRNYTRAFDIYNGASSQNYWWKAQLKSLLGDSASALVYYDSLKTETETNVMNKPGYFVNHVWLGIAYAGLGLNELAIEEAEIAQELMPYTKDALSGMVARFDLLKICILTGNYEKAIDEIEVLLSIPSDLTVQMLKLDPLYDPL
jgi:non-specific serine/threonine protein kinase